MATIFATDQFELTTGMKIALVVSGLFHIAVVIMGMMGLPFISKPHDFPPPPIAVEIVDVSELTTTNKPPSKSRLKPVPDKPKEAPKVEKKVEAPPKVEAKEPPKIKPLDKPKVKKETVKPEPKTPPPPSEVLEKPKPPEKKKEEPKEEAVQQEDPLLSLMKNLQEAEEAADTQGEEDSAESTPDAPIAPTITAHELNALSSQLAGCWQIPIGAENVHDTVVDVRIWVGQDRVVRRAEIADQWRMANDAAFRALAESAKRATLDPRCNPVDIPMEKYDVWKDKYIQIPFDPRALI